MEMVWGVHACVYMHDGRPKRHNHYNQERTEVIFKKTTRSIVAKLVREGVYVAAPRVTKTGAPVVRKGAYVSQINDMLGMELPSLEKASKADLEALVSGLNSLIAAR